MLNMMIFVIVTLCITGVMSTSNFATKLTTAKKSAADQIKILTDFFPLLSILLIEEL